MLLGACVDGVEDGPVAGDLGLGAVARGRLLRDELLEPVPGGGDVLDRVRGLDALDQRDLLQRLERGRMLAGERLLAAAGDVDPAQLAIDRRRDQIEMRA